MHFYSQTVLAIAPFQRRNDREEIRRKLAMGLDEDQTTDRPHRKPSLHSRLQSGKLLSSHSANLLPYTKRGLL